MQYDLDEISTARWCQATVQLVAGLAEAIITEAEAGQRGRAVGALPQNAQHPVAILVH